MALRAYTRGSRFIIDQPADLPEGVEVDLVPFDPGDRLDAKDRAALRRALAQSEEDVEAGRLFEADDILRELRTT